MRVQETTYEHLEISVLELGVNNAGNLSEKGFEIGIEERSRSSTKSPLSQADASYG